MKTLRDFCSHYVLYHLTSLVVIAKDVRATEIERLCVRYHRGELRHVSWRAFANSYENLIQWSLRILEPLVRISTILIDEKTIRFPHFFGVLFFESFHDLLANKPDSCISLLAACLIYQRYFLFYALLNINAAHQIPFPESKCKLANAWIICLDKHRKRTPKYRVI